MSWRKITLEDICISIADGDHQPPPKSDNGIPFVTISNITNTNKLDFTDTMFVSQEYYDNLNDKRRAHTGDILYSVVGSFGIPVFIDKEQKFVFQRHIAILRPDPQKIVPRFLYYMMLSRDFYMKADTVALGAAQRTISLTALRKMEMEVPPYNVQEKIVKILKPFDDLIENNQKQIKLLEEAAQRLYKEWFVDLRFPGYEKVKIVNGVPEGWKTQRISKFGEIVTGKTPSTAKQQYYGGTIPFVKIPDMYNCIYPITTEVMLTTEGANTQRNKFIPKGSIMVSCIATVGLVNIATESCQTNQQINSIILNDQQDLYYIFFTMKCMKNLLEGVGSNGATMTNVNRTKFGNIEVLCPTKEICKLYYDFCKPIFMKIFDLSISNNKLSQARDRLLPKLISGELEV